MACESYWTCASDRKNLTLEQVFKMMIIDDGSGCPILRTQSEVEVTASIETPINSATTELLIEEDDNATCLATLNAWKAANPSKKVIFKIATPSINKQAWLITYTT